MPSIRSLLSLLALGAVAAAAPAHAQTVTAAYAPSCGPTTPCSVVRFALLNATGSPLLFDTFTLTAVASPFRFDPLAGGPATFQAEDAFGPFGGVGLVSVGGTTFDIDFVNGSGFQLQLDAGTSGYVEAALATTPRLPQTGAFTFAATVNGAPISGAVTSVPEPSTFLLLASGLAIAGVTVRRRRA